MAFISSELAVSVWLTLEVKKNCEQFLPSWPRLCAMETLKQHIPIEEILSLGAGEGGSIVLHLEVFTSKGTISILHVSQKGTQDEA